MRLLYFHTTSTIAWETGIQQHGLFPYDLGHNKDNLQVCWPMLDKGIWLWSRMDEKLAHESFLWQRTKKPELLSFMILACEVERKWLLFPQAYKRCKKKLETLQPFLHPLLINDVKIHEEPFDICLEPIPPERLTPLFLIEQKLIQIDKTFRRTFVKIGG